MVFGAAEYLLKRVYAFALRRALGALVGDLQLKQLDIRCDGGEGHAAGRRQRPRDSSHAPTPTGVACSAWHRGETAPTQARERQRAAKKNKKGAARTNGGGTAGRGGGRCLARLPCSRRPVLTQHDVTRHPRHGAPRSLADGELELRDLELEVAHVNALLARTGVCRAAT